MDEDKAEKIVDVIWERWEEKLYSWELESPRNNDEARALAIEALLESKIR